MNLPSKSESGLKGRVRGLTRQAILEAAEETFAAQGLHGARMEDVAARAGVSVGTIYNHVGDRQALLATLLEVRRAELIERIDALLAEERPFERLLVGFVRAVLEHFEAHRPLFQLLIEEEVTRGRTDPRKATALRELADRAGRVVDIGVDEGVLRAEDARYYPALLVGMLRGCVASSLGGHESVDPLSQAVEPLVRTFLGGAGRAT